MPRIPRLTLPISDTTAALRRLEEEARQNKLGKRVFGIACLAFAAFIYFKKGCPLQKGWVPSKANHVLLAALTFSFWQFCRSWEKIDRIDEEASKISPYQYGFAEKIFPRFSDTVK